MSNVPAPKVFRHGTVDVARAPRRVFVSLGWRITVPVVLLVVGVAALVYLGLVKQSRGTLLGSKRSAAEMVVRLTSVSVMPAVVFGDPDETQRAVNDLAQNPDVTDVEIWSAPDQSGDAEPLLASFHRQGKRALGRPATISSRSWFDEDSVRLIQPVVSLEGKTIAVMVVRFTTAPEIAALARLSRQILYVSAGAALGLAAAILWAIGRIVVRPVKRLQEAAQRLARGDGRPLERAHGSLRVEDEVVRLAERFTEMAEAVRDREARLGVRNTELKLILDSVKQGFLTALPDGTLLPERSAIVAQWTGALPAELDLPGFIGRIDPRVEPWVRAAWAQVVDAILPIELAIDQLPKRLERDGQYFDFAYHPVLVAENLDRLVVVVTDVTAEVERQRTLAEQQEFSALVDQFVRDRRAFQDFWNEASKLVREIVQETKQPEASLVRSIHTLKGNARFFALHRVSRLCHALEGALQERGEQRLNPAERLQLSELWSSLSQRIEPLMHGSTAFVDVSREEYEKLLVAVQTRAPFEHIEELLKRLRREPLGARLDRAQRLLEATCEKLEKTLPRVVIRHDELRLPSGPWAPFWSALTHVLNNAADHGLEPDEERAAAGKPVPGTVWLSAHAEASDFVVEVRDDGRGIDWNLVRQRATVVGLPRGSQVDLVNALLADGFTLKESVSEVSGRGVGLAAVRGVVTAMGGKIEVQSELAKGTAWRFRFPLSATLESSNEEMAPLTTSASLDQVALAG